MDPNSPELKYTPFKIDYRDCFVAFIDALGFRTLLNDQASVESYYNTCANLLGPAFKLAEEKYKERKQLFAYRLMSDSIVLAIEASQQNPINDLVDLLSFCKDLQVHILRTSKVWVRGGVSRGEFFENKENNVVVGKGLAKAYELEQIAKTPRIIIDPLIAKGFGDTFRGLAKRINDVQHTRKTGDKLVFDRFDNNFFGTGTFETDALFVDWFNEFDQLPDKDRKQLTDSIQTTVLSSQEHIEKYRWSIRYMRSSVYGLSATVQSETVDWLSKL